MKPVLIKPQWPLPQHVKAFVTTRAGGASIGAWEGFNLGVNCGDKHSAVEANRRSLASLLPAGPKWMKQVHGSGVAEHDGEPEIQPTADAMVCSGFGRVCAVLTADCLPVLFSDAAGRRIGVAHAGWRGLVAGVLENTVRAMGFDPVNIHAWLGPAIGPACYEVGEEVRAAFMRVDAVAEKAFHPSGGRWLADLYMLARQRLFKSGVTQIYGGHLCTYSDARRFFSYRRDGTTGRMATVIWLDSQD